jgi:hypothetical protein
MIKKNTKAIFLDGDYVGEYDWKGGIPLTEGEIMIVKMGGKELQYKLDKKEIVYSVEGDDQMVDINYSFKMI